MTKAYYNEIDPGAARWLDHLISAGKIPAGDVDTRSIEDVTPADLAGYTQCHFFAGIGGWPLALRRAGWPDDVPVWSGSPPCQPFSTAGLRAGFEDRRHLWPVFARLIAGRTPPIVFGEQVSSGMGYEWVGHVSRDLAGMGYRAQAADLPACAAGAPHLRQRMFWSAFRDPRWVYRAWETPWKPARWDRRTWTFIPCRDQRFRRIEPGIPLLEPSYPGRVAQLRGLGNAIVPPLAELFVRAVSNYAQDLPRQVGLTWAQVVRHVVEGWNFMAPEYQFEWREREHGVVQLRGLQGKMFLEFGDGGLYLAGWPTPAARDGKGGYQEGRTRHGGISTDTLDVTVRLAGWTTPNTMDSINRKADRPSRAATGRTTGYLSEQLAGWPTVTGGDSWTPASMESAEREAAQGNLRGIAAQVTGWPTPRASESTEREETCQAREARGVKASKNLTRIASLAGWNTPIASDTIDPNRDLSKMEPKGHWGKGMNTGKLCEQAKTAGWPTPVAGDSQGGSDPRAAAALEAGEAMPTQAQRLRTFVRLTGWPTPDHSSGSGGRVSADPLNLKRPSGSKKQLVINDAVHLPYHPGTGNLSPSFSEWLMGYDAGWIKFAL